MATYTFRKLERSEAGVVRELVMQVWETVEDKETFAVESMDLAWYRQCLLRGYGIAAVVDDGEMAGVLLVDHPGEDFENLGRDLGFSNDMLGSVYHMDTAAVLPAHRGNHLEKQMLLEAEKYLPMDGYQYLMCTVSPKNPASLKSLESAGYKAVMTKEKYGGKLRHIMLKQFTGM